MSIRVSEARTATGRHYPLTRIGPFVRSVRKDRNLPQWKVAKEWAALGGNIRDTQSIVSEVETSKSTPDEDLLLVIAQWVGGNAPLYTLPGERPPKKVTLAVLMEWRDKDLAERKAWAVEGRKRGARKSGARRTANARKEAEKRRKLTAIRTAATQQALREANMAQPDPVVQRIVNNLHGEGEEVETAAREPGARSKIAVTSRDSDLEEMRAMVRVTDVLTPLSNESRAKVLSWAARVLGVEL